MEGKDAQNEKYQPEGKTEVEKTVEKDKETENSGDTKTDAKEESTNKPTQNGDATNKPCEDINNSVEESNKKVENVDTTNKPAPDLNNSEEEPNEKVAKANVNVEKEDKDVEKEIGNGEKEIEKGEKEIEKGEKEIEKGEKVTRGVKRKANVIEKDEPKDTLVNEETVEQKEKENVNSKNNDNVLEENQSKDDSSVRVSERDDTMGKGKRARIPNKRYSDILLTPNNRKSLGQSKLPSDSSDPEPIVVVKEEPVDTTGSRVESPTLPFKKNRVPGVRENLQEPKFLKPFKFGWKRELVWRSTSTTSKPVGDIYYYTPTGKKVRSFRELADYLQSVPSKNLTVENFSFTKEPIGLDNPEKEIIRDAKIKSSENAIESPVVKPVESIKKSKRVLSPKATPKFITESTKAEDTPTKNKVELTSAKSTPISASKKTKMPAKKGRGPAPKRARLSTTKNEEPAKVESTPVRPSPTKTSKPFLEPCSIQCAGCEWVVPTLQCKLCLCLYHHACVGLTDNVSYPYVCKNCQVEHGESSEDATSNTVPPPLTPINTLKSVTAPISSSLPKLQRIPRVETSESLPPLPPLSYITTPPLLSPVRTELPKLISKPTQEKVQEGTKSSLVGAVTTWLPHNVKLINSSEGPTEVLRPQYLEFLGGRKYLVIPKHNFMSVSSATSSTLRSEQTVTPANSSIPEALQPAEISASSASLGLDTTNNNKSEPLEEIKEEPLSPSKVDEKSQQDDVMEVDTTLVPNDTNATESKELGDVGVGEIDDEANQSPASKLKKRNLKLRSITNSNTGSEDKGETKFMENYLQNLSFGYNTLLYVFQYLKVQDLLRAGCVCTMWRDIASHPILWRTVRMKNSQVHSFDGLANTLKKHGTTHLDLRKMLLPSSGDEIWPEFSKAIAKVDTLRKIELCRCPASVVENLALSNPHLEVINAVTIKCESMNLGPLKSLTCIKELRLKSTSGLNITSIDSLKELKSLRHLSLTSVNDLHKLNLNVIAELKNLESLDLGECTDFPKNFGVDILSRLDKLEKLRLEKGQGNCHVFEILEAAKGMKKLEQLELVNFDVKSGFDKALGACTNIKKLMIIPTYISQSATTNNMVLSGVLRLQGSLTHFVWGVTLELLRVTELFVDQCEEPKDKKDKKPAGNGDSIPVLKPVPDLSHGDVIQAASNPPQVEILPLPNLQKLLLNSLPTTRVKILKIPFHATWRQTLTDSV